MSGADGQPLRGPLLAIVAVALALGTFMQVLDATIANVSLTTIAGNLGVSSDNSTWVITAFAMANGVTVPLTGWLMRRFGLVRTFVASVSLFTLASFLCGIAWSLPSLIVFRLIQGGVSGPMIPGSQALLIAVFPSDKRPLALGVWAMTMLVGPIAGPILGGYISDNYHWGWIFLINVPVGILSALVTLFVLKGRDAPGQKLGLDVTGIALLVFWVGSLQAALDLGKNADWFHSTTITVLVILAAIGFFAWLIWEVTDSHPAVDLSLFKNRNFALATTALSLGYAVFFANNLLMPLWLQREEGYTATWAGLVSAPSGLVAVALTLFLTRFATRVDARWLATLAFVAFGVSYGMRAGFTPDTDFVHFMLPMLAQGVAMSVFFTALVTISLDGVPPEKLPSATGISNFARITAGSFAASMATDAWDRREALHQTRLSEIGSAYNPAYADALGHLQSAGLTDHQVAASIASQVGNQSYLLASTDLFWLSSIASFALVVLVWLTRRPAALDGPVAAD